MELSLLSGPQSLDKSQNRLQIILSEKFKPRHNTETRSWLAVKNPLFELRVGMLPSMALFVMGMRPANASLTMPVPVAKLTEKGRC